MVTPLVVGLDLGGTKILGRLADPRHPVAVLAEHRLATPRGPDAVLAALADVASTLVEAAVTAGHGEVAAVGVGVAGLVDRDGVLRTSPNLHGVADLPVRAVLAERLRCVVAVDNDASCAMRGEHRAGAAAGVDDAVLVTLGTGIGGGLVIGGRLHRGRHGFAGEPGHMVVDPDGPPCPCGKRGCWERFASGSGLGRLAREAAEAGRADGIVALAGDVDAVRGEHVGEAARLGDPGALAVLDTFAWWVALGLATLVDVLDPEVAVIGGGLADLGDLLLKPTRSAFDRLVLGGSMRPATRVELATLGSDAGSVGAALLGADAAGLG
ncbi:MAG: ROK family protein [Acidimicrobiales bacterium]|nr:ROK family protein [Acidimicrobiales bacterium]